MKPLVATLVILGAVAILADDGTVPTPSGTAPRFQLVVGVSRSPVTGESSQETFRLDTWTGETWRLSIMPLVDADGKSRSGFDLWQRIQEPGSDMHQQASRLMEKNVQSK